MYRLFLKICRAEVTWGGKPGQDPDFVVDFDEGNSRKSSATVAAEPSTFDQEDRVAVP